MTLLQAKSGGFRPWVLLGIFFVLMFATLTEHRARAADALCAEVKIVIAQKLSLERQAFDAHMVITNGLDAGVLENVSVTLKFLDRDGNPVVATSDPNGSAASFFVQAPVLSGIAALDGTASVATKSSADIHWLIIPTAGAGGNTSAGQLYYIGASLRYTLNGQVSTVDVAPDYVVVRPLPQLKLDYFLPRDVYGDDPFTLETEPSVPFTLGVRLSNAGAGVSSKTQIESAQPKIVENRQGLLIDFSILGGYVGDQAVGKSLLLNFGDINPGTAKVGRWLMVTSLAGRFVEFNATYSHADSLGGALTSLIKGLATHTLVHDVKVDLAGRDGLRDFLALDVDTLRVYESDNVDSPVIDQSASATLRAQGSSQAFNFPATAGLVYAKVADPYLGAKTVAQVLRSDGKVLPVENAWLSKTRNADLSWNYYVNIFDSDSTGSYTLGFTDGTAGSLSGTVYVDSNGNGVKDAGDTGLPVLAVTLKGQDDQGLAISTTAYTDSSGAFKFSSITPGRYQLTAAAADGLVDGTWLAGTAGGTASAGLISNIVLAQGSAATGYLLGKRQALAQSANTIKADVGVQFSANPARITKGGNATVSATVTNQGPGAAAGVTATVSLPQGVTLQNATVSKGSLAGGVWTLGQMAVGESATYTGVIKAVSLAAGTTSVTISGTVGSTTEDPVATNNAGQAALQYAGDSLVVAQAPPREWRWLVLVGCSDGTTEDVACAQDKAAFAQSYLTGKGVVAVAYTQQEAWRTALRSGKYQGLWVNTGRSKLGDTSLAELREAVRRGAYLILEGEPDTTTSTLSDVLGNTVASAGTANGSITPTGGSNAVAVSGNFHKLQAIGAGAATLATYASGDPALITSTFGQGNALTAGFDLLNSLKLGSTEPTLGGLLQQQLDRLLPQTATTVLARSYLPLETTVNNQGDQTAGANIVVTLPSGASSEDVLPQAGSATSQAVSWQTSVEAGKTQKLRLAVRPPLTSGNAATQTVATSTADASTLATLPWTVSVLGTDTLIPRLTTALTGLSSADSRLNNGIAAAQATLGEAQTAYGANDFDKTLSQLSHLQAQLSTLGSLVTDSVKQDVANWMGIAEAQWQEPGNTGQPQQILATQGSPQQTRVSTAFANPLSVQVVDAQGLGVQGVAVNFALPTTGAAASFPGGATQVTAATDGNGLAVSPTLTANAQAGSYQAVASVTGLSATASFTLTNLDQDRVPTAISPQGGTPQQAVVGNAFAQALTAKVVDAQGQAVAGVTVNFGLPASGASASFPGGLGQASATTDASGLATSPRLTANAYAGSYQATAQVSGIAQGANFALTNLDHAPAASVVRVISGNAQTAVTGAAFAQALKVQVLDGQGAGVGGIAVQFSLPVGGASATFTGGSSTAQVTTSADGMATSPILVANGTAGSYQASASVTGLTPVSFTLTNQTAPVTQQFVLVSGGGQSALLGTGFAAPVVIRVTDAANHPLAGVSARFTLPATGASATFAGGAKQVDVVSGADGLITTPLLTANAMAGDYNITVTPLGGGVPPFPVLLHNQEVGAVGNRFVGTTPTGTGKVTVTVSGGGATCAFDPNQTSVQPASGLPNLLKGILLPHGVLQYALTGCTPGSTINVVTTWPNLAGITGYLKYGPTPASPTHSLWYVPSHLAISGNRVSYTVTDGGLGDDDLTRDGVIHDPGGPVIGDPISDNAIPVVDGVLKLLLAVLLAMLGGFGLKRSRRSAP